MSEQARARHAYADGRFVLVREADGVTLVASARTVDAFAVECLRSMTASPPVLVVSPTHLEALGLAPGAAVDAAGGVGDGDAPGAIARTMRAVAGKTSPGNLVAHGHVRLVTPDASATQDLALSLARLEDRAEAVLIAPVCDGEGRRLTGDEVARHRHMARLPVVAATRRRLEVVAA
jgi:hypothetical protein